MTAAGLSTPSIVSPREARQRHGGLPSLATDWPSRRRGCQAGQATDWGWLAAVGRQASHRCRRSARARRAFGGHGAPGSWWGRFWERHAHGASGSHPTTAAATAHAAAAAVHRGAGSSARNARARRPFGHGASGGWWGRFCERHAHGASVSHPTTAAATAHAAAAAAVWGTGAAAAAVWGTGSSARNARARAGNLPGPSKASLANAACAAAAARPAKPAGHPADRSGKTELPGKHAGRP